MHWSNTVSLARQGFLNDGVGDSIFEVNGETWTDGSCASYSGSTSAQFGLHLTCA